LRLPQESPQRARRHPRGGGHAGRADPIPVSRSLGPAAELSKLRLPNVLAAFYRWCLDHRRGGMTERTARSYAYAISALLRQLLVEDRLPASVSLEKLRLGLREALAHGDYLRRKVDPRIDAFVAWVASQPIPPPDGDRSNAQLGALRARALVLTLYCSGLRREEVTALETAEVLGGTQAGEADVRGKGDRERTVFLDPAAVEAIRDYVNARGARDTRK
jgi:integrase